ncbi:RING finger protein 17-like isoform X1 [Mytilus edulis]|uniref:RING finger protein 17-like isoform X1 n=2 Tax=Mytilus edulis TaxID=6550 RepID=UPI0039EFB937
MQKCPSCPKCCSFYSTKDAPKFNRNPVLLHCGHTFCAACLNKLARENKTSITCPTCQVPSPISDDGIKSLWPDVYTTGMIVCNQKILLDQELSKLTPAGMNMQSKRDYSLTDKRVEKLCRECCRRLATCKCDRCDFILCKICFNQIHGSSNTLRQHQAIPLSQEESSTTTCQLEVSSTCAIHDGKLIEYYCEDDHTPVCSRCVITGEHKNHSILSMEEKNKVVISEMEPAMQTANRVIKKLKKAEKSLSGLLPDMKGETTDVIQEITTYYTGLHGVLQAREKQLIQQVYDAFKAGVEPLHDLKQEMQDNLKQLESAVKAAQRVLSNSDEVVLNAKDILQQLQRSREIPCIVEPKQQESSERIRFEKDHKLMEEIIGHGMITGTVPSKAAYFTLSDKPECLVFDDTDSAGTQTPSDSVSVVSRLSEDVILEDQSVDNSQGSTRSMTPDLDIIPSKGEKIRGSSTPVIVTHVRNPCLFMVQKCSDQNILNKLSKAINSYARSPVAPIPKKLARGDMVLSKFKDDKWYRARVRDVNEGNTNKSTMVEVLYIDFGNSQKVPLDRIRTIQPKHSKQPELLIECCLHDIRPANETGAWSEESISTFVKMTENHTLNLVVVREVNNVLHVDLSKPPNEDIKDDRPISVRDSLVFLELAKFISPDSGNVVGQTATRRTFIKPEPKSRGCSFTGLVTCAGDPSAFYVQEITEDSTYFAQLMGQMQDRYNRDMGDLWFIYCPQMDMPCVCKYSGDDMWYRAKVIGIPGNKQVDVQYVDFGNTERVPYWRLRKLLDHFIMMPVQALPCRLTDITPASTDWSSECNSWWIRKVTMKVFSVHVTDVKGPELNVILQDDTGICTINGELVGAGHAISTGKGSSAVPPQYLQPVIDSSDESVSVRSESLSSRSGSYVTPISSPLKLETSPNPLRQQQLPARRDIGLSPSNQPQSGTSPRKQQPPRQQQSPARHDVGLSPKLPQLRLSPGRDVTSSSPVNSLSPQKEKSDSPEKYHKSTSSSGEDSSKSSLRLDVEKAKQHTPIPSPGKASDTSDPESPAVELEVIISQFTSPTDFYVQLATAGENGLNSLMEDIGNEYRLSEDQWVTWEVGNFCAARHSDDKRWYRAKILSMPHKSLAEVFMVDYGYICQVGVSEIRPLQKPFLKQMCYAFSCHLADIVSAGDMKKWSRTACEFMAEEVKNMKMYIQKKGNTQNDSLPIDLLMEEDISETALEPSRKHYYSLTDKLIEKGLAIPINRRKKKILVEAEAAKIKKIQPVCYWKPAVKPMSSSILGMPAYVDFEGIIWVQELKENEDTLYSMVNRLQEKFVDSEPHGRDEIRWQEGQACIAVFHLEEKWHRARILKVEPHRIQVEFVDFGNVEYIRYDNIRADVLEFIEIPIQCMACMLHNVIPVTTTGKWPVPTLDKMHTMVVNKPCVIDIKSREVDRPLEVNITLPDKKDLSTILYKKGLCYRKNDVTYRVETSNKIGRILSSKRLAYPKVKLAPKNEYFNVCITNVEAPDVIYFQHCKQEENNDERTDEINEQLTRLQIISVELNQVAHNFNTLPIPKPGLPCLGQYTMDNSWYRGLIIEVDPEILQARVLYVDYGNSEILTFDRLRALPIQFLDLPAQGVRMKLNEVRLPTGQKYWTEDVLKAMVAEVENRPFMACLKTHNPVTGDLLKISDTPGEPLELAYQSLINQGLLQAPDENQLFDEGLIGQIEDDVIVEREEVVDLDTSTSTTKGDNSFLNEDLTVPEERTRTKSWSDQCDDEDSLD